MNQYRHSLFIVLAAALLFISGLGNVHLFDWDEINFAEVSREMMALQDYLVVRINYQPFWEKPPLFFWMQVVAMKTFGINEFAARLPNAICGVLTLLLLFKIGQRLYDTQFGLIWALTYAGSILPFLYFKSGIIDPFFNLFIFLGLYYFILGSWKWRETDFKEIQNSRLSKRHHWTYTALGGMFIGLGILTKGPVALLIAGLAILIYWGQQRFRWFVSFAHFMIFGIAALLVTALWFGLEIWQHGTWFLQEFITYQIRLFSTSDAGHKGFFGFHFVVLLVGCFPASVFAIRAFFKTPNAQSHQADFKQWMIILFWVVLILFSVVQSKIIHYSSMCYFPLTFLATLSIYHIIRGEIILERWTKIGLGVLGGILVLATFSTPFLGQHIEQLKPLFSKDPFATANLDARVVWTGWEVLPSLVLLAILIAFYSLQKKRVWQSFQVLFGGMTLFMFLLLTFFINRIEGYSQRAAIEFFESKADEDCYIFTHAYKSYAHFFYARKRPMTHTKSLDTNWLIQGEVDKPTYGVAKIHKAKDLEAYGTFKKLYSKNGFVFFKRKMED